MSIFQSTLPARGATRHIGLVSSIAIFQSTLPVGGSDLRRRPKRCISYRFQSTLPVGEATGQCHLQNLPKPYFNPRSPRGGATFLRYHIFQHFPISIHAPRGGSDASHPSWDDVFGISIHAPRGGSDALNNQPFSAKTLFQSTLPAGGATNDWEGAAYWKRISIHAPRGGSDEFVEVYVGVAVISIHAPRGGSDHRHPTNQMYLLIFQSTLPAGGATLIFPNFSYISQFQSTLPAGGATCGLGSCREVLRYFNPRSPRGERLLLLRPLLNMVLHFNPRSPRGERQEPSSVVQDNP